MVTEEKWNFWNKHVGGFTGLVALELAPGRRKKIVRANYGASRKASKESYRRPFLLKGSLYVVKNGGILTAFDAKTGERLKTGRITGALGGYSASPVLAEGRLYLASEEGKISIVRPGREWEVVQVNDLGEEIFATPALSGGRIFARTSQALYCFGLKENATARVTHDRPRQRRCELLSGLGV